MVGIELVLEAAHEVQTVHRPPHVDGLLHLGRRVDHDGAALVPGAHVTEPRQRLRYVVRAAQRGVQHAAARRAAQRGPDLAGCGDHVAHNPWYASFAVLGIVLAALYILLMVQRTMTGPTVPAVAGFKDLGVREVTAVAPLLILIVLLGFYPKPLTSIINPAVHDTLQHVGVKDPVPAVPAQAGAQEENAK